nr:hypothetical protein GCM10020092_092330 [Actinoplanes digitatis]
MASFPGHVVVAADVDRPWVDSWLGTGDNLSAPLSPRFLGALEERLRLAAGNIDAVLLAPPAAGEPAVPLTPIADSDHPRVVRAREYRQDVRAWTCGSAVLVLGRGLAGRWEAAVEVAEDARNKGLGRFSRGRCPSSGAGGSAGVGPGRSGQRGEPARLPGGRLRAGRRRGPVHAAATLSSGFWRVLLPVRWQSCASPYAS